jgi:MFS family permease
VLKYSLVGDFVAGYVHDICGRRLTIFFGFIIAALCAASFPLVPSVWPYFLILRIVMTIALSGPNNHPLVADYVKNRSRGLASA